MFIDQNVKINVGEGTYFSSTSHIHSFGVVFEDDTETGFFYAIQTLEDEILILDALHIYNVDAIPDNEKSGNVQIQWSDLGTKAFLFINKYCHAVFDFENKLGYSRTGFPPSNKVWSVNDERILTDTICDQLMKE